MPQAQAGAAAAVASTSRQVGVTLGVAMAGTMAGVSGASGAGAGFAQATHPVWWTIVAMAGVVFVLALLANSSWGRRSTEAIAHLLAEPASQTAGAPPRGAGPEAAPARADRHRGQA
jgi:protein-disulfide isomerase-like protein with CxxC motif